MFEYSSNFLDIIDHIKPSFDYQTGIFKNTLNIIFKIDNQDLIKNILEHTYPNIIVPDKIKNKVFKFNYIDINKEVVIFNLIETKNTITELTKDKELSFNMFDNTDNEYYTVINDDLNKDIYVINKNKYMINYHLPFNLNLTNYGLPSRSYGRIEMKFPMIAVRELAEAQYRFDNTMRESFDSTLDYEDLDFTDNEIKYLNKLIKKSLNSERWNFIEENNNIIGRYKMGYIPILKNDIFESLKTKLRNYIPNIDEMNILPVRITNGNSKEHIDTDDKGNIPNGYVLYMNNNEGQFILKNDDDTEEKIDILQGRIIHIKKRVHRTENVKNTEFRIQIGPFDENGNRIGEFVPVARSWTPYGEEIFFMYSDIIDNNNIRYYINSIITYNDSSISFTDYYGNEQSIDYDNIKIIYGIELEFKIYNNFLGKEIEKKRLYVNDNLLFTEKIKKLNNSNNIKNYILISSYILFIVSIIIYFKFFNL